MYSHERVDNRPDFPVTALDGANYEREGDRLFFSYMNVTEPMNALEEASNAYAMALELRPDNSELMGKMTQVLLRQGHFAKAAHLAQKLVAQAPGSTYGHLTLGYLAGRRGAYNEAVASLGRAIRSGGVKSSRARFCLSNVYGKLARKQVSTMARLGYYALSAWQLLASLIFYHGEPRSVGLAGLFGLMAGNAWIHALEAAKRTDDAREYTLKLHERFPGAAFLMCRIARAYHRAGQYQEASFWYQRAVTRDPLCEEGMLGLIRLLEERGDYERALTYYQRLVAMNPNDGQIHCGLANAYYWNQECDKALAHYKAAYQLVQDRQWQASIMQSIGYLYEEAHQDSEAAQMAFRTAADLDPANVDNHLHLGILLYEKGDFLNARVTYEQALRHHPGNPRLHANLGYLQWINGEIENAIASYEEAMALDCCYDVPYNNLGVIQLDIVGDIARAVELLNKAIELNENYALAYYNLGRAYTLLNRKLEAAQSFQRAKQLNEYTRELDSEELAARIESLFNTNER